LEDSEFDSPACGICRGEVTNENVLRLQCFHLFHPECVDIHASSLPANAPPESFTCSVCNTPVIPPATTENNGLITELLRHLRKSPWTASRLGALGASTSNGASTTTSMTPNNKTMPGASVFAVPTGAHTPIHGVVSRKGPAASLSASGAALDALRDADDEDDKYRRRDGVQRLLGGHTAVVVDSQAKATRRARVRLSWRRFAVLLIAVPATFAFVYFLAVSSSKLD